MSDLTHPDLYLNRELSELEFERRVLHEAEDERNPLLERVTALRYFAKNTDEFFMKRIGGLKLELEVGVDEPTVDGMTPESQWLAALERFRAMQTLAYDVWQAALHPQLEEAGVSIRPWREVPRDARQRLRGVLERDVLPLLTPLAYDPAHPFPHVSNLSVSLAVLITGENGAPPGFTRIKVPTNLDPFVPVQDGVDQLFIPLVDLIRENLDLVLPGRTVESVSLFRVTRSAEVRLEQEVAEDLVEHVEDVLEKRRTAHAVRLELSPETPPRVGNLLRDQLHLSKNEVFRHPEPMTARDLRFLSRIDRPAHRYPEWTPRTHPGLAKAESYADLLDAIRSGDVLVHHPYHSFEETTQAFLDAAARDERVRAIKIAIYRTANDSKVIQSLVDAAERGKQAAAIVELKARFDERRNVEWVRRLEEKGIHVAYGMIERKTHTKLALVVRDEDSGLRFYSHIGTGNYHSGTAKAYVDLGLLTADQDVGHDVMRVFNIFTGPLHQATFRKLLVAPFEMKRTFLELISSERELGSDGRIVAKVNAVEDPDICRALYEAAGDGVEIDLICRDICRVRPELDGVSETIHVHSVVGRFLEHSRIFFFGNGDDPRWYLGSADWMGRNLEGRMEAVVPVENDHHRDELEVVLRAMLADNRRRWVMDCDGGYAQVTPGDEELDAQRFLMARAASGGETELPTWVPPLTSEGGDSTIRAHR